MKSDKINRRVTENINLIYLVMKRFRNRGVDREDLFQIGAVGLTKAAQRFDESKGFAFSTYAVPLIIGEIQRFLRDDGMVHISRKIRDDARKIAIIREKYRMNENSEISLEKMEIILKANLLKGRDAKPEGTKVRKFDHVSRLPLFPYHHNIWKRCLNRRDSDTFYTI